MFGELNGTGTLFSVNGYGYMDSEQFGNFHFGVISNAWGINEFFAEWGAGIYQIWSNTSPDINCLSFLYLLSNPGTGISALEWSLIPPHGDDSMDYHMIKVGFWYFTFTRGAR